MKKKKEKKRKTKKTRRAHFSKAVRPPYNVHVVFFFIHTSILHLYCNRFRCNWRSCCSSSFDEKHLPVM